MQAKSNTDMETNKFEISQTRKTALRMILYMAMASITMFFAVTTSALLLKKADVLNWAQFPLPNVFGISTLIALASSVLFYLTYKLYQQKNFKVYRWMLFVSSLVSIAFLGSQLVGFQALTKMGMPLNGNVSGSFIYFLAIVHALHIGVGLIAVGVVLSKSYLARTNLQFEGGGNVNPRRVLGLELLSHYWHFVNVLWVYLFLFFYFNYQ
jgi:cytochrome c oxidase subunit III